MNQQYKLHDAFLDYKVGILNIVKNSLDQRSSYIKWPFCYLLALLITPGPGLLFFLAPIPRLC